MNFAHCTANEPQVLTGYSPNFSPLHALQAAATRNPQRINLVGIKTAPDGQITQCSYTVSQSFNLSLRLAQLLKNHGVTTGDRVIVTGPNSIWHLLTHVACAALKAVSVPLDQHLSAPEFDGVFTNCTPKLVFCADAQAKRLAQCTQTDFEIISFEDLLKLVEATEALPAQQILPCDENTLGALVYTSGTTARPKGVSLTHANLWWASRSFRDAFEYSPDCVEAVVAPLSHIGGFNGTTIDLFSCGGTVVVIDRFIPAPVLKTLEKYRVQMMFAVPTMYQMLLDHPDFETTDLQYFTRVLVGGAPLSKELSLRMRAAKIAPINVWGMTEQSASGACLTPQVCAGIEESVGTAFPFINLAIAHPDSLPASAQYEGDQNAIPQIKERFTHTKAGEIGELLCAGPSVTRGYFNNDESNRKTFIGPWLRTGDLGYFDEDGRLFLVGRAAEVINTGGEKVLPGAVVSALRTHERIKDIQVVAVPDPKWGQAVGAVVILEDDGSETATDLTLESLREFGSRSLARYKLPHYLAIVQAFPLLSNGKVDRCALVKLLQEEAV